METLPDGKIFTYSGSVSGVPLGSVLATDQAVEQAWQALIAGAQQVNSSPSGTAISVGQSDSGLTMNVAPPVAGGSGSTQVITLAPGLTESLPTKITSGNITEIGTWTNGQFIPTAFTFSNGQKTITINPSNPAAEAELEAYGYTPTQAASLIQNAGAQPITLTISDSGQITANMGLTQPGWYGINGNAVYVTNPTYIQNELSSGATVSYLGPQTQFTTQNQAQAYLNGLNAAQQYFQQNPNSYAYIVFNPAYTPTSTTSGAAVLTPQQGIQEASLAAQLGNAGTALSPSQNAALLNSLVASGLTPQQAQQVISSLTPAQIAQLQAGTPYMIYFNTPQGISSSYTPQTTPYSEWQQYAQAQANQQFSPYNTYIAPLLTTLGSDINAADQFLNANVVKPVEQYFSPYVTSASSVLSPSITSPQPATTQTVSNTSQITQPIQPTSQSSAYNNVVAYLNNLSHNPNMIISGLGSLAHTAVTLPQSIASLPQTLTQQAQDIQALQVATKNPYLGTEIMAIESAPLLVASFLGPTLGVASPLIGAVSTIKNTMIGAIGFSIYQTVLDIFNNQPITADQIINSAAQGAMFGEIAGPAFDAVMGIVGSASPALKPITDYIQNLAPIPKFLVQKGFNVALASAMQEGFSYTMTGQPATNSELAAAATAAIITPYVVQGLAAVGPGITTANSGQGVSATSLTIAGKPVLTLTNIAGDRGLSLGTPSLADLLTSPRFDVNGNPISLFPTTTNFSARETVTGIGSNLLTTNLGRQILQKSLLAAAADMPVESTYALSGLDIASSLSNAKLPNPGEFIIELKGLSTDENQALTNVVKQAAQDGIIEKVYGSSSFHLQAPDFRLGADIDIVTQNGEQAAALAQKIASTLNNVVGFDKYTIDPSRPNLVIDSTGRHIADIHTPEEQPGSYGTAGPTQPTPLGLPETKPVNIEGVPTQAGSQTLKEKVSSALSERVVSPAVVTDSPEAWQKYLNDYLDGKIKTVFAPNYWRIKDVVDSYATAKILNSYNLNPLSAQHIDYLLEQFKNAAMTKFGLTDADFALGQADITSLIKGADPTADLNKNVGYLFQSAGPAAIASQLATAQQASLASAATATAKNLGYLYNPNTTSSAMPISPYANVEI
ncbi:MAG: hypothetical protein QW207_03680, partial [Candidatus Micrarchaeaceae archaeon]